MGNCYATPFDRALAEWRAAHALQELYANRADIYGFRNRFAANWWGLRANAVGVLALIGIRLPDPEWTATLGHHAGAGVFEYSLKQSAAIALDVTPCQTQWLVPFRGADGLAKATAKLEELESRPREY